MVEVISKKVSTAQEQATIDLKTKFGWKLKSSQEINNTDSHLERRGDELYSVTTKENYVKLVFERDKNMPNYRRIVELERKYENLLNSRPQPPLMKMLGALVLCIVFLPLGIYVGYKVFKDIYNQGKNWGARMQVEARPILEEVSHLL